MLDAQGNPVKPDVKANDVQIGSINTGYYTVENGTVEVRGILNGRIRVSEAKGKSKSEPKGVHTLTDSLIEDLRQKFGVTYTTEKAVLIMENGGSLVDGQWQDYQLSDQIKNSFGQNVLSLAKQVWNDDDTRSLYRIILTGGGANIIKDTFAHIPQLIISDNPQWDTVEGYQRLAKAVNKRG